MPLDEFAMNRDEIALVARANEWLIHDCLATYGMLNPLTEIGWTQVGPVEDRRYGIWIMANAETYGYEMPPDTETDAAKWAIAQQSPEWQEANMSCQSSTETLPLLSYVFQDAASVDGPIALGFQGYWWAFDSARLTSEWREAREDWWNCLRREGLEPRTSDSAWSPVIDSSESIGTAVTDVGCKLETDFVQRLAQVEAQAQLAFVEDQMSGLREQRQRVDAVVEQASIILDDHEGSTSTH